MQCQAPTEDTDHVTGHNHRVPRKRLPPPPALHGFPGRLREAMADLRMTPTALAELSKVSQSQIARWSAEVPERWAGVEGATLIRLASALRVRVGWLLAGELPKSAGVVLVEQDTLTTGIRAALRAELASRDAELKPQPPRRTVHKRP